MTGVPCSGPAGRSAQSGRRSAATGATSRGVWRLLLLPERALAAFVRPAACSATSTTAAASSSSAAASYDAVMPTAAAVAEVGRRSGSAHEPAGWRGRSATASARRPVMMMMLDGVVVVPGGIRLGGRVGYVHRHPFHDVILSAKRLSNLEIGLCNITKIIFL